jgi:hypothetical protein
MTASLTPALALAYLSELSADIRAAVVLDAGGEALAVTRGKPAPAGGGGEAALAVTRGKPAPAGGGGEAALVAAARDLLAEGSVVRALTERGGAFGARDDRHGIAVATGPLALPKLAVHDVLSVLSALGGAPPNAAVREASPAAAEALLNAL